MVSPPHRVYIPYVAQRCSESASKNTKNSAPSRSLTQPIVLLILFLLKNLIQIQKSKLDN